MLRLVAGLLLIAGPAHAEGPMKPEAKAVTEALAARARSFERYSAAPLGFPADDYRVTVRLDVVDGDKGLYCERRSGSKSEIKRAFRDLAAALKRALPKDWTLQDQGDVLNAYSPGEFLAVALSWSDRKPGLLESLWWRGTPPSKDERYVLTFTVYPLPPRAAK